MHPNASFPYDGQTLVSAVMWLNRRYRIGVFLFCPQIGSARTRDFREQNTVKKDTEKEYQTVIISRVCVYDDTGDTATASAQQCGKVKSPKTQKKWL